MSTPVLQDSPLTELASLANFELESNKTASRLTLPSADVEFTLCNGDVRRVPWGQPWQYMTAAYWASLTKHWLDKNKASHGHGLGSNLGEEVVACLLGGHGISYEINVAAFESLLNAGLVSPGNAIDEQAISAVLKAPLQVLGRSVHYRFPNQKAVRIAAALQRLHMERAPSDPGQARDWLMTFSGVGPKTASWIVRNQYPESNVAIIDIHVQRAAVQAHVFDAQWSPAKDYWKMESAFLEWARIGEVPASDLDAIIWRAQAISSRRRRVTAK